MVAVFTGLGAGFQRSSATQLPGGLLGSGSQGRGGENISVNAATGNLVLTSRQDEFLVGRGSNVGVSRTYNSLGALDDNGDHWRQSTDRRVISHTGTANTNGATVKRISADGSEVTYTYHSTYLGIDRNGNNITGSYRATDGSGAHDSLVYGDGKWTWSDGDSGNREIYFGAGGYIKEQIDRDGNKVTFTYNASNQLHRVTSANGDYIQYNWAGNRIDSVTNSADGGTTDYQYDTSGRLNKVVGDGYWVAYSYHGATNQVKSVTQQDGSRIDFTYDAQGRVFDINQYPGNGEPVRITKFRYASNGSYTDVYDPGLFVSPTVIADEIWGAPLEVSHPSSPTKVTITTYAAYGNIDEQRVAEVERGENKIIVDPGKHLSADELSNYMSELPDAVFSNLNGTDVTKYSTEVIRLKHGNDVPRKEESIEILKNLDRVSIAYQLSFAVKSESYSAPIAKKLQFDYGTTFNKGDGHYGYTNGYRVVIAKEALLKSFHSPNGGIIQTISTITHERYHVGDIQDEFIGPHKASQPKIHQRVYNRTYRSMIAAGFEHGSFNHSNKFDKDNPRNPKF